jgi:8-oxo-dGTP diphosphatase
MAVPQFGDPDPAHAYRDRPAAFGILMQDGNIALVTVKKPQHPAWLDLPGGAIDPGEDDLAAVVREFGEETGLAIAPGELIGRADQYFVTTEGERRNNRQAFFAVRLVGEAPQLKIEADHSLVWMAPLEAISRLRHESHAWAVALSQRRTYVRRDPHKGV